MSRPEPIEPTAELSRSRDAPTPSAAAPNRRPAIVIFLTTLVLASVVMFVRVRSTEIELDGTLTALSFVTPERASLSMPGSLAALGVTGLLSMELPDEARRGQSADTPPESSSALLVAVDSAGRNVGSIVLDRIVVPAETRVSVSRRDISRQYRIAFRSAQPTAMSVHADVQGAVQISPASAPGARLDLTAPRAIELSSTSDALMIDITLGARSTLRWQQLAANSLQLYSVEEEPSADRPLARPLSTLRTGSLYFESLGGDERKLRGGELIRFDDSRGAIRTLELGGDQIALTFQGDVRGMRSGAGEQPRSIMPTLLQWLRQRQGLSLLWGTSLWAFGVVMSLRRWWRRPE